MAADVAREEIYPGNMHNRSRFHNLRPQPESWPVVRMSYAGTDCGCTASQFGWYGGGEEGSKGGVGDSTCSGRM